MKTRRGRPVLADVIAQFDQCDKYRAVEPKKFVRDSLHKVVLRYGGEKKPFAVAGMRREIWRCLDNLADREVIDPNAWETDDTVRVLLSGEGFLIELPKWLAKWLGE